jgi:hypothetical protein
LNAVAFCNAPPNINLQGIAIWKLSCSIPCPESDVSPRKVLGVVPGVAERRESASAQEYRNTGTQEHRKSSLRPATLISLISPSMTTPTWEGVIVAAVVNRALP